MNGKKSEPSAGDSTKRDPEGRVAGEATCGQSGRHCADRDPQEVEEIGDGV